MIKDKIVFIGLGKNGISSVHRNGQSTTSAWVVMVLSCLFRSFNEMVYVALIATRAGRFIKYLKRQTAARSGLRDGLQAFLRLLQAYDRNRVCAVYLVVFHPARNLLTHLLNFGCQHVIKSLKFGYESVEKIVDGHLVPFIHWYEDI